MEIVPAQKGVIMPPELLRGIVRLGWSPASAPDNLWRTRPFSGIKSQTVREYEQDRLMEAPLPLPLLES